MNRMKKDRPSRSILKAISWRILATITTILVSYVVIGDIQLSTSIGLIELIFKIGLYYAHERFWQLGPLLPKIQ